MKLKQFNVYNKYIKQNVSLILTVIASQGLTAYCYVRLPNLLLETIKQIVLYQKNYYKYALALTLILISLTFFSFVKNFCIKYIKDRTIVNFRINLANYFFKQDYISKNTTNNYVTHISNETNEIGVAISDDLVGSISNAVIVIAMSAMLFKLNFVASFAILAIILIIGICALWGTTFIEKSSNSIQYLHTKILNVIQDYINNYQTVFVFSLNKKMNHILSVLKNKVLKKIIKRDFFYSLIVPIVNLSIYVMIIFLLLIIFFLFKKISTKIIFSYIFYSVMLVASFSSFVNCISKLQESAGALHKINSFISNIKINSKNLRKSLVIPISKNLEITGKNLVFRYNNNRNIIDNLNFKILNHEVVAVRGKSGSGKSTFIELLLNLLKPSAGTISYNGQNILNINRSELYKYISVVFQEPYLFDDTIRNNIDPRSVIDSKSIIALLNSVGIDINLFSEGLDTYIGNNNKLISRGQAQRIALARAIAKDPEILILDEVTASVDDESGKIIENTIEKMTKKCTVIFTSHRKEFLASLVDKEIKL
ncbi:ATP-binding cassette domain-containing protein [Bombilactobacillus mellis]|uniref:ATP-binding cassette domain-containing protein n=1 Tax=Bombilactobacillus mellis TaxID=1218508 RepID=UPI00157FE0F0|nr:ABC transporter ATP-binding protein [Bombilactobacillus mellis]NUF24864.1 ABC transporter ATP-binding protein [Bombilactobacillus mellis]